MPFERLQIKHLSRTGELLSLVNCNAGQITVLRAHSHQALLSYQHAIVGMSGPERFAITLDGEPFEYSEHITIGFGEDSSPCTLTVADFLKDHGVPKAGIASLLLSYGLDNCQQSELFTLDACARRRVRLLAATHVSKKVLVLNDPFEPLASNWRERFAELICQYARTQKTIVLVVGLTHRPNCWIDNEAIMRVQVGENTQQTIGFGAASGELNSIVSEVRRKLTEEKQSKLAPQSGIKEPLKSPITPPPQYTQTRSVLKKEAPAAVTFGVLPIAPKSNSTAVGQATSTWSNLLFSFSELSTRTLLYLVLGSTALGLGGYSLYYAGLVKTSESASTQPAPTSVALNEPVTNLDQQPQIPQEVRETEHNQISQLNVEKGQTDDNAAPREPAPTIEPYKPVQVAPVQMVVTKLLLDQYPALVKQGLLATVGSSESVVKSSTASQAPATNSIQQTEQAPGALTQFLNALPGAEGTGSNIQASPVTAGDIPPPMFPPGELNQNGLPFDPNVPNLDAMSRDERREYLRQRFREAIERATQEQGIPPP